MYTNENNVLRIVTGNEFKIYIAPDGIISEREIFWDEYLMAAKALNCIVGIDDDATEHDYQNNIIAFCGDRGTGKTSAMINFGNAIKKCKENSKLNFSEEVKKINVVQDILVDPSVFDEIHSILDIVVAKMYEKFSKGWRSANIEKKEKMGKEYDLLICSFQKVYGELSLINNSSKILDNEYDYDGNVGKLSMLGKSMNLKKDLKELISYYLEFVGQIEDRKVCEKPVLLLEIDDIDLCSGNAYKMVEEIRKYLMLPNVVILMAVRLEQLELCMEEHNYKDFNMLYKINHKQVENEVRQMTAKYLLKLIPESRRIMLSQKNIYDSQLKVVFDNRKNEERITDVICKMLYDNIGIVIPKKELELFLPKELRGVINLLVFLHQMKSDEIAKKNNIRSILNYTRNVLIKENGVFEDYREMLFRLIDLDARWLNDSIREEFFFEEIDVNMNTIVNLNKGETNYERYITAVMVQFIYALKLNADKSSLEVNLNYNVWGACIANKLPEGKDKVKVNTIETLIIIGKSLGYALEVDWLEEGNGDKLISKPTMLKRGELEEEWIEVLLTYLSFLKIDGKQTYISKTTSSFINKEETIGLTNFLTNIQNMDRVVMSSGILNLYPEDSMSVWNIADEIKDRYKGVIEYLTKLYMNPLLFFYVQKAILEGKEYKEKADEKTRLRQQCERILENVFGIPRECSIDKERESARNIYWEVVGDVAEMYANIVTYRNIGIVKNKDEEIKMFERCISGNFYETGAIWYMKIRFNKKSMSYSELKYRMETIAHNIAVRRTTLKNQLTNYFIDTYEEKFFEMLEFYRYVCEQNMEEDICEYDGKKYREYVSIVKAFLSETEQ